MERHDNHPSIIFSKNAFVCANPFYVEGEFVTPPENLV